MTTLELELVKLKARVERLEAMVRSLIGGEREVAPPSPAESLNLEQLQVWLKAEGLIRAPTSEEQRHLMDCYFTLL